MARGRIITKKVATSRKLASLSSDTARLLWTWMIPFLDIEGRMEGYPAVVLGTVCPRLRHITIEKCKKYLQELHNAGLIVWYKSDGDNFIQFTNFQEEQGWLNKDREAKSSISPPTPEQLTELSVSIQGVYKDKDRDKDKDKDRDRKFDEIYEKYPRKVGTKKAREHFNASVKTEKDWADINKALANYLKSKNVVEGNTQYIQHASTWFNNWQEWIEYTEPSESENENAGWA